MSNLLDFAKKELKVIGLGPRSKDSADRQMYRDVLKIVDMFSKQEHSGFSAGLVVSILEKVLRFKPACPLTGCDNEWNKIGDGLYQNKRCSSVFKDSRGAYDIDGVVFKKGDSDYYTNKNSRVRIKFPYVPVRKVSRREWYYKIVNFLKGRC